MNIPKRAERTKKGRTLSGAEKTPPDKQKTGSGQHLSKVTLTFNGLKSHNKKKKDTNRLS